MGDSRDGVKHHSREDGGRWQTRFARGGQKRGERSEVRKEEATREADVPGVQEKQSEAISKTEKWIRGERGDLTMRAEW